MTTSSIDDDAFGVLSVASDSDSHWDEASATTEEEYGCESTDSFRMPALDGVATRNIAAPKGTFEQLRLPAPRKLPSTDLEVILFAPMAAARTISTALRAKCNEARGTLSVQYFNGSGLSCLDDSAFEDTVGSLRHRFGVLYYSATDTYDPSLEYDLFVSKYHRIPCIALSDRLLDPFCLQASSVMTTSPRHLMRVATFDGRQARIPISMDSLREMSLSALVPVAKDAVDPVPVTQFNRSPWSAWATNILAVLALMSTVSLFILHLSAPLPVPTVNSGAPLTSWPTVSPVSPVSPAFSVSPAPSRVSPLPDAANHQASAAPYDVLRFAYSGINLAVGGTQLITDYALSGVSHVVEWTYMLCRSVVDAGSALIARIQSDFKATAAFAKRQYHSGRARLATQKCATRKATSKAASSAYDATRAALRARVQSVRKRAASLRSFLTPKRGALKAPKKPVVPVKKNRFNWY